MPTRTDVQTDVHIVPVDSDSSLRNLLKVQTVRCALVLYKGNHIPSLASNFPNLESHWPIKHSRRPTPSSVYLMHLNDIAIRVVEKNLLPARNGCLTPV